MARSLIATEAGIKRAKEALIDLGMNQTVLVKRLGFSRSTVGRFFKREPIAHENFTEICKILKLEWRDIAEIDITEAIIDNEEQAKSTTATITATSLELQQISYEANQTEKQIRLAFAIEGTVDQVDQAKLRAIVKLLQHITGDTSIEIIDIQEGSIKLILAGTPEALVKIQTLYRSGKLTEIAGVSTINVGFENLKGASLREVNLKEANLKGVDLRGAILIEAILLKANLSGADLRGTDLSRADIRGADLIGAIIKGADLCHANLSGANLSGADLSGANLSEADFSRVELRGADLSGANLSRVDFSGANLSRAELCGTTVELARFGFNKGISEEMKRDLISRGAIFEDSQGDNSRILFPLSR